MKMTITISKDEILTIVKHHMVGKLSEEVEIVSAKIDYNDNIVIEAETKVGEETPVIGRFIPAGPPPIDWVPLKNQGMEPL